jgi:hypothetical protein
MVRPGLTARRAKTDIFNFNLYAQGSWSMMTFRILAQSQQKTLSRYLSACHMLVSVMTPSDAAFCWRTTKLCCKDARNGCY